MSREPDPRKVSAARYDVLRALSRYAVATLRQEAPLAELAAEVAAFYSDAPDPGDPVVEGGRRG